MDLRGEARCSPREFLAAAENRTLFAAFDSENHPVGAIFVIKRLNVLEFSGLIVEPQFRGSYLSDLLVCVSFAVMVSRFNIRSGDRWSIFCLVLKENSLAPWRLLKRNGFQPTGLDLHERKGYPEVVQTFVLTDTARLKISADWLESFGGVLRNGARCKLSIAPYTFEDLVTEIRRFMQ